MRALNVATLLASLFLLALQPATGYDNKVAHPAINKAIVAYAEANLQGQLAARSAIAITMAASQYTGPAVTNPGFFDLSTTESDMSFTLLDWVKHGGYSADEPELAAAVRHFYDPIALSGNRKYLTNRGTYWEGVYSNPGIDAIEWALGDTPKGSSNKWTLQKGKEYLVNAFELADSAMKARNLARAFRCLGEVLHNTGDMGCPPHTRNDSHAAPLGHSGGAVLGSPDPYEELFEPDWAAAFSGEDPDPTLASYFRNATTIRSIDEKLAEFTNNEFFTSQTICGVSNGVVAAINTDGNYPSPRLERLEYNPSDFTYYQTLANGVKAAMCKDRGYFSRRCYPYIDKACVRSQAKALIPNIMSAGSNVIRLFFPQLGVKLTKAKGDGTVEGSVGHTASTEYPDRIDFSGRIEIVDAGTNGLIGTVECSTGSFADTLSQLKEGDQIYARLKLGGLEVRSEETTVGKGSKDLTGLNYISINLLVPSGPPDPFTNSLMYINNNINTMRYAEPFVPLKWTGSSCAVNYSYSEPTGSIREKRYGSFNGQASEDWTTMTQLTGEETRELTHEGSTAPYFRESIRISIRNLSLEYGVFWNVYTSVEGQAFKNVLTSILHTEFDSTKTPRYRESTTIDWNNMFTPRMTLIIDKQR